LRDEVTVQNLKLKRPFDLGGDDPKRLKSGLPVLIDALPRQAPQGEHRIFCFRTGYGHMALLCRTRWPNAKVVVSERDLLASTFLRINAEKLGLEKHLEIREHAHFPDAFQTDEKFHLILGEISPSAGESVALEELKAIENHLATGGQAILLCLEKLEKDWVKKFEKKSGLSISRVLTREGFTALRLGKV